MIAQQQTCSKLPNASTTHVCEVVTEQDISGEFDPNETLDKSVVSINFQQCSGFAQMDKI